MTKSNHPDKEKPSSNLTEMEQNFLRAARAGNLNKVIELLSAGVNINLCNPVGLTALHLASKEGYANIVKELIQRGADFDAPTRKGNTALHIASLAGHLPVIQVLLDAGANVNRQSGIGFTPLYMAAQENHLDVVDLLLKRGANQALTTEDGFTPLAVALQQGHERVVSLLLERDSRSRGGMPALHIAARKDDVNAVGLLLNSPEVNVNHQAQHGFTPLHIAAHYGNVNVARPLLERGADVNFQAKNCITPLHIAAKWGRTEMARLLLRAGALVDCRTRDGLTPLHCAARSGHADLAALLMDAAANPSAKTRNGLTPLHMGAQGNNEAVVQLLILRGASVEDKTGDMLTPLHVAAHCGNAEVAQLLLENRCDVNPRALNGFTPLHIACKKNKLRIIDLLLQYGAKIDMSTESGLSPLHVAAFIGSPEIVEILLQHGAHVDQATMRCETALHLAVRNRQVGVARALIHHGATVDAKAKDDHTPLHIAVLTGHLEMIALLLSVGADTNVPTRDAYTAMHIAAREGHHEVIRLLLEAHANPSSRTQKGFTPLHLAAKRGRVKAAQLLLHAQPKDAQAVGLNNLTPLHLATHYNHLRMVELLLDSGAEVNCLAGNGYTPLHIAAKHNHLDIATLLLANESDNQQSVNAESRSGFTPLHLAAQEGHTDMVSLLLQHGANPNHQSKNGLAPLHLAAQENHVPVAQVLLASDAEVSPLTRAGYSPLHTACHFGQLEMVRFLLDVTNARDINLPTQMGFTPLHLATQQGHSQVVCLLLEMGADGNKRNQQGLTAAHIARRQHFVTIFDILKTVTTTVVSWEEEEDQMDGTLVLDRPDYMREHPLSESDDETGLSPPTFRRPGQQKSRTDESLASAGSHGDQKSRTGTFSMGMDTGLSVGENDDIWGQLEYMRSTLSDENPSEIISPQAVSQVDSAPDSQREETRMFGESVQVGGDWELEAENVHIVRKPISTGFLVSFLVDARGGLVEAQRRPNLRFFIPPNATSGPVRIVCRLLHPDRMLSPPPINDGDGFACRVLELGPLGLRFNSPIVLEIPHYAFLTDKNREVIVLRSDNGETWKEHPLDANDQAVYDTVNGYFDKVHSAEELRKHSVHRILTYDLPQYFALITRIRQELILIGPEGGVLSSNVVRGVSVEFPPGALQKKICVGLQVHSIEPELVARLFGPRVSVCPIVTIEPRRRKFHKPITLKMPLPNTTQTTGGSSTLRLLCSISGGTTPACWEEIRLSSPLAADETSVSFTTTISARLWVVDCPNTTDVVQLATRVYHESLAIPYLGRFVVYGRRHHPEEAQLRCLCLTDDSVDKTLEKQEGFQLLATGPPVEVLDDHPYWIETAGNLVPVAKTEEQLQLCVQAFRENRLNMIVRVKDLSQEAFGKLALMRHPRAVLQSMGTPQKRVTVLEVHLPDGLSVAVNGNYLESTDIDQLAQIPVDRGLSKDSHPIVNGYRGNLGDDQDFVGRSELDLRQVANLVGSDWPVLAARLGLPPEHQTFIHSTYRSDPERAYASLVLWQDQEGHQPLSVPLGTKLAQALHYIGRADVLEKCMLNVTPVVSPEERRIALDTIKSADHDIPGPFSDTSGLGSESFTAQHQLTSGYSPRPTSTDGDDDLITPVSASHGTSRPAESAPKRPVADPVQRATALKEVHDMFTESDEALPAQPDKPVREVSVEEDIIIPEVSKREDTTGGEFTDDLVTDPNPEGYDKCKTCDEFVIEPAYHQPCGLNEATWGRPQRSESEEALQDAVVDESITATIVEPTGLRECTWGKPQAADQPPTKQSDAESELTTAEAFEDNLELKLPEAVTSSDLHTFSDLPLDDIYGSAVLDFPTTRIIIPSALSPIPEASEYSGLASSRGSLRPTYSWGSEDLSRTGSVDGRNSAIIRALQSLKAPSERYSSSDQEVSLSVSRTHDSSTSESDPRKRLSISSTPSEAGCLEPPTADLLHTKASSSHSSLLDFLRLENSCESSRADLSEEDRQLLYGQHDASLRDLVSSIQALQRQYIDDPAESIPPISGGSSSGSYMTSASNEAERRLGAVNQSMLRSSERSPPASIVTSLMDSQLQRLIHSVSTSSSSVSSPPPLPAVEISPTPFEALPPKTS